MLGAALRRLVLVAAAATADAFVTTDARWSMPVDSTSVEGLSRGLSFVIDSGAAAAITHLTALLSPQFPFAQTSAR